MPGVALRSTSQISTLLPCASLRLSPARKKTGWPKLTWCKRSPPVRPLRGLYHMSTKTKVHRKQHHITGHPFHSLPKVGMPIATHHAYPTLHERYGNADCIVLHSVLVDDGVLQVVGAPDDGIQEWVWFREDGTVWFTRSGWGSVGYALHDGLKHAYGEEGHK